MLEQIKPVQENTILQKILAVADTQPTRIAVSDGDQQITYSELCKSLATFRDRLGSLNIQRLGIYLDNSFNWVKSDLAAMGLCIPVIPVPHFFSLSQKLHLVENSEIDALIAPINFDRSWCLRFDQVTVIDQSLAIYRRTPQGQGHRVAVSSELPNETAKITYTSGSTGMPKGVCLSARLLCDTTHALSQELASLDIKTHLSVLPYSTLLENIAGLYLPMSLGARVYCISSEKLGIQASLQVDAQAFAITYQSVQPQSMIVTPQILQLLCHLIMIEAIDVSALKFVAVGGSHCSNLLLKRASDLGLPVYQGYGLSECGSVISLSTPQANHLGAVGKPLGHVDVSCDSYGNITVAGNQFGRYLKDEGGFPSEIKTGDVGEFSASGFLTINGRSNNMIVLSTGRNISPEWVESELTQQNEIAQCMVYGDRSHHLSALIVPPAERFNHSAIAQAIKLTNLRLPAYAHVKQWSLVTPFTNDNSLLTSNGKLVRKQILAAHRSATETEVVQQITNS